MLLLYHSFISFLLTVNCAICHLLVITVFPSFSLCLCILGLYRIAFIFLLLWKSAYNHFKSWHGIF